MGSKELGGVLSLSVALQVAEQGSQRALIPRAHKHIMFYSKRDFVGRIKVRLLSWGD